MILNSIYLKNYRSFDSTGYLLHFSSNSNIILGENNVGKTSILEALRILTDRKGLNLEDFHKKQTNERTVLCINCTLDSEQIQRIITHFKFPYSQEEFGKYFSNCIDYTYEYHQGRVYLTVRLGDFCIQNYESNPSASIGFKKGSDRSHLVITLNWDDLLEQFKNDTSKNPNLILTEISMRVKQANSLHDFAINFPFPAHEFLIVSIISEKIIPLEEYCEKPQTQLQKGIVCRTGKNLVSILSRLKNGTVEPKNKYEEIRTEFTALFPELDVESIIDDNEQHLIQIQSKNCISTTNYIGSGIIQTLFILTHVIAHPDKVLCIDEPELHLHPHVQKGLSSFLFKKGHQTIIVTHSPYFIDLSENSSIHRVIQKNNVTSIVSLTSSSFNGKEIAKLEQVLDIDTKELFFARKVIFVEGESEIGALPIFAKHFDYDFNKFGVSLVFVDGMYGYRVFIKLCNTCKIPYLIIADNNAKSVIDKLIEEFPDVAENHFLLSVNDFNILFSDALIAEAKKEYPRSKPRQGKYMAREVLERNFSIPNDITLIFSKLKS